MIRNSVKSSFDEQYNPVTPFQAGITSGNTNKNGEFDAIKHHQDGYETHRSVWNDWQTHWTGHSKTEFEKDDSGLSYDGLIKSLKKSYDIEAGSLEIDSSKRVLQDYTPYIKSQTIIISAYGLKPNVGNLRIRFDGKDITAPAHGLSNKVANSYTSTNKFQTDKHGKLEFSYRIPNINDGYVTLRLNKDVTDTIEVGDIVKQKFIHKTSQSSQDD